MTKEPEYKVYNQVCRCVGDALIMYGNYKQNNNH